MINFIKLKDLLSKKMNSRSQDFIHLEFDIPHSALEISSRSVAIQTK